MGAYSMVGTYVSMGARVQANLLKRVGILRDCHLRSTMVVRHERYGGERR